MPIESPALDDLTYADINQTLVRRIPIVAPEWTDHNDSDPGITLIQLFSYLAEQIGYRLNRVPEKNYIEFLKMIGVRLRPAEAARTTLAFFLAKPEAAQAFLIPAGSGVKGKPAAPIPGAAAAAASPPPVFETDVDLDAVPAQLAALATTRASDLRQLRGAEPEPDATVDTATFVKEHFSLVWDGKTPKLKEMPGQPLPLFSRPTESTHRHLWIGLAFNPARPAGFVGQRVTLTVQLDDDELPASTARVTCATGETSAPGAASLLPTVGYEYYRPAQPGEAQGTWRELPVIADATEGWTRSGQIRFDVPQAIGPVPDDEWQDLRAPPVMTTQQLCKDLSGTATPLPKQIPHPLVGAVKMPVDGTPKKVPVSGWLHVAYPANVPSFSVRMISFNVAPATNAETVARELIRRGDGLPGQTAQLAFGNVLAGTLQLAVADPVDTLLHDWTEVESFDGATPDDTVYLLDPEAGLITFGDGLRGRPPAIGARIVALRYRHGGGKAAELDVGLISKLDNVPSDVQDATNIVTAQGGKDAETLDDAKARAPIALKTFGRAVTAEDFVFFADQTPGVRVKKSVVVALRRPYADPLGDGPGLDLVTNVPGALSVIVVPDAPGPYPTPTDGMLRKVCAQLDRVRLVTTEVYTTAPQYIRIFNLSVRLQAKPGVSAVVLREAIATRLETAFHVLTGGPEGTGLPFGSTVHHADLVAQVFQIPGVQRVEQLDAFFDGNAPAPVGEAPPMTWRLDRSQPLHLTGCIVDPASDVDHIALAADENVFVDASTLEITVV